MKQNRFKGEMDAATMVIGNFNILLSRMDRISNQQTEFEQHYRQTRSNIQYRTLHPTAVPEHIHLKGPGNTSLGRQMLGHEVGNRFKKYSLLVVYIILEVLAREIRQEQ